MAARRGATASTPLSASAGRGRRAAKPGAATSSRAVTSGAKTGKVAAKAGEVDAKAGHVDAKAGHVDAKAGHVDAKAAKVAHVAAKTAKAANVVAGAATKAPKAGKRAAVREIGGISSDAVKARTGKTWSEWFDMLDAGGGAELDHRGLVAAVTRAGVGPWWSQMVSVGYEQARGKREPNQRSDGFGVSASKTYNTTLERAYQAFVKDELRQRWLKGAPIAIERAEEHRSIIAAWTGGGRIEVTFTAKEGGRAVVRIDHTKLPNAEALSGTRTFWLHKLEALKALVER